MFSLNFVIFAFCKLFFCHMAALKMSPVLMPFKQFPYQLPNKNYIYDSIQTLPIPRVIS